MGRKNRPNKKERKERKERFIEEEDDKGFEALTGSITPQWWDKMDSHQLNYDSAIRFFKFIMVDAKAGTGKTTIAVKNALEDLKTGRVDIIRYVRFVDQRTQKLGYLPGNDKEKEQGFMFPFFEAMEECGMRAEDVWRLIGQGVIEMSTDIHMRGRNMKRTFLIVDECQNGDTEDMKVVFTRVDDATKTVAIGHSGQTDRKLPKVAGLIPFQVYQRHMLKKSWAKSCPLVTNYRGDVSQWADEIDVTIEELRREEMTFK
jgi:phosphate starvation-inducible protein PhoH and related proteins